MVGLLKILLIADKVGCQRKANVRVGYVRRNPDATRLVDISSAIGAVARRKFFLWQMTEQAL